MNELKVLQAVRLKGRVNVVDLAMTIGEDPALVASTVARLAEAGLLVAGNTLKLSTAGRQRLTALLADEHAAANRAELSRIYNDFRRVNAEFKALVTDWQLREGQPNNHDDPNYDVAVLARLDRTHERILPIIAAVAAQVPRLSAYGDKLSMALEMVHAGRAEWFTRPSIDSYHTVWFELHEELILATGLTRQVEAEVDHSH
jgi:hypothetical protein